jgi:hypothetical protein
LDSQEWMMRLTLANGIHVGWLRISIKD